MIRLVAVVFTASIFITTASVQAQTCNEEGLLACSHVAIENCRSDNDCIGIGTQANSVQDAIEDVANRCCAKSKQKRINRCIKNQRRKIAKGRRFPGKVGDFLREIRQSLNELRKNGCDTGSLGEL